MREPWANDADAPEPELCRECGGYRETLMYYLENAIYHDDEAYEIVEMHPCPYCVKTR